MSAPQVTVSQMTLANGSTKLDYSNGTFIVNNNVTVAKEFSSFICTGKVAITDLRIVGSGADVRSSYISAPSNGLAEGCVITAINGTKFSSITTDGVAPVVLVL